MLFNTIVLYSGWSIQNGTEERRFWWPMLWTTTEPLTRKMMNEKHFNRTTTESVYWTIQQGSQNSLPTLPRAYQKMAFTAFRLHGEKSELRRQAWGKHGLHCGAPTSSSKKITQQVTGNLGIQKNGSARSLRTVVRSSAAVAVWRHTIGTGWGQQVRHMDQIRHVHPRLRRSVMTTPRLKTVLPS